MLQVSGNKNNLTEDIYATIGLITILLTLGAGVWYFWTPLIGVLPALPELSIPSEIDIKLISDPTLNPILGFLLDCMLGAITAFIMSVGLVLRGTIGLDPWAFAALIVGAVFFLMSIFVIGAAGSATLNKYSPEKQIKILRSGHIPVAVHLVGFLAGSVFWILAGALPITILTLLGEAKPISIAVGEAVGYLLIAPILPTVVFIILIYAIVIQALGGFFAALFGKS